MKIKRPLSSFAGARTPRRLPKKLMDEAVNYFTQTPLDKLPAKATQLGILLYAEVNRLRHVESRHRSDQRARLKIKKRNEARLDAGVFS